MKTEALRLHHRPVEGLQDDPPGCFPDYPDDDGWPDDGTIFWPDFPFPPGWPN